MIKIFCINGHDITIVGRDSGGHCNECDRILSLKLYHMNKKDNKARNKRWRDSHKKERAAYIKQYTQKHKVELKEKRKQYRINNPDKIKDIDLKRTHHITLEEYNKLLIKQNGKCIGCLRSTLELSRALNVDHDHRCCSDNKISCGKCIRGLLCGNCNKGLGCLKDNIEILLRLVDYLRKNI